MKYLEVAQNYYISDFTIINLYNEYGIQDGFKVIDVQQERADKCKTAVGPYDAQECPPKRVATTHLFPVESPQKRNLRP